MTLDPARTVAQTPDDVDARLHGLLGYTVKRVSSAMMADAARVLDPHGLRVTTFSALSVICDAPDITQSALAQALAMERSNIVVIIDTLEETGLIARHRMDGDRRAYALRATLKGLRRRDAALAALMANEDRELAALTPDERRQLSRLLRCIRTGGQG
jgi:DNA-binding MarR family transcriptional regulator